MPITNITMDVFSYFIIRSCTYNSAIRFKFFKFKRYKSLRNDAIAKVRNTHYTF